MSFSIEEVLDFFQCCEIVDLSHTLEEGMPVHPTQSRYYHMKWTTSGAPFNSYQFIMHEHNGTHVDSPCHYRGKGHPHQISIDLLPLYRFMGRCVRIDFSNMDNQSLVGGKDIQDWEESHSTIHKDDIVLFYFGLSKKWGIGQTGEKFIEKWPGLSKEAVTYCIHKDINAVGTDALSIDGSDTETFIAHNMLLRSNILIFECLNQLDRLPDISFFLTLPLKIKDGTASPVRAVAFISKK